MRNPMPYLRGGPTVRWSGRLDSNQRPPEPHSGALPNCATPRSSRASMPRAPREPPDRSPRRRLPCVAWQSRGSRVVPAGRAAIGVALLARHDARSLAVDLERWVGVPDASATYLLAVLASAVVPRRVGGHRDRLRGVPALQLPLRPPELHPRRLRPGELLNLILLLVLGIAVGQLAAAQRSRAQAAIEREHEATALFRISRTLATRTETARCSANSPATVQAEADMDRVWIGLARPSWRRAGGGRHRGRDAQPGRLGRSRVLRRMPGDTPHAGSRSIRRPPAGPTTMTFGSTGSRSRPPARAWARSGPPARADGASRAGAPTRLLAAAADQIGQAIEQDRLAAEARQRRGRAAQ